MQIITAPSKTQDLNFKGPDFFSQPHFLDKSLAIIEQLSQLTLRELSSLMKTSEKLTQATREKIDSFSTPFDPTNANHAIFTFKGDAYDAITPESYTPEQLLHLQRHLLILSGLYGALKPLDLMQPYRLEMGLKLPLEGKANLYKFWQLEVTSLINNSLQALSDKVVVNLASQEYSRVVDKKKLQGKMVTVVFKQRSKTGFKTIPIHAKRARGLMLHYVIVNGLDRADHLRSFDLGGYRFDPAASTDSTYLFYQDSSG